MWTSLPLAFAVFFAALPVSAQDVTLYGVGGVNTPPTGVPGQLGYLVLNTQTLFRVDPATAVVEAIGPTSLPPVTGLSHDAAGRLVAAVNQLTFPECDPDVLPGFREEICFVPSEPFDFRADAGSDVFGVRSGGGVTYRPGFPGFDTGIQGSALAEIDPETGAGQVIGEIDSEVDGGCARISGLAADDKTGALYGLGDGCEADAPLYEIDPTTGAGSPVGPLGPDAADAGFTYWPATDQLLAAVSGQLAGVDPATGEAIAFAETDPGLRSLSVHPESGVLYALLRDDEERNFLVTIDPVDGSVATVGELRDADGNVVTPFAALAFSPRVPCPDTPRDTCVAAEARGSKLKLTERGRGAWKWRGRGDAAAAFGDPTAGTDTDVCLYDSTDDTPRLVWQGSAPAGERWIAKSEGFVYKGGDGPVRRISERLRHKGRARIKLKLRDADLPDLPLSQDDRVVVQLANDAGSCWESVFESPAVRNDRERFKDRE